MRVPPALLERAVMLPDGPYDRLVIIQRSMLPGMVPQLHTIRLVTKPTSSVATCFQTPSFSITLNSLPQEITTLSLPSLPLPSGHTIPTFPLLPAGGLISPTLLPRESYSQTTLLEGENTNVCPDEGDVRAIG